MLSRQKHIESEDKVPTPNMTLSPPNRVFGRTPEEKSSTLQPLAHPAHCLD